MDISKAMSIPGSMSPEELQWLAEQASTRSLIIEIGSDQGRSTRALADNTRGTVYAVDLWEDFTVEDESGLYSRTEYTGRRFDLFCQNMAGCDNVRTVETTSLEAAQLLDDVRFDMIFIDASHDYESVKADILAWQPLIREGGLLCGHDYTTKPGVKRAVDELIQNFQLVAGCIWRA